MTNFQTFYISSINIRLHQTHWCINISCVDSLVLPMFSYTPTRVMDKADRRTAKFHILSLSSNYMTNIIKTKNRKK